MVFFSSIRVILHKLLLFVEHFIYYQVSSNHVFSIFCHTLFMSKKKEIRRDQLSEILHVFIDRATVPTKLWIY